MEQKIKPGDFVRLTDPISNGEIIRVESVDEHGFASWLGGSQYCDMEQIKANVDFPNCLYYDALSSFVERIEQGFATDGYDVKLYPKSAVEYWKHRAEIAEQSNALNEKLLKEEHNKLLDVQDNIEKLQSELSRCRAMNADYLTAKKEAENEVKILKQEIADLKVPENRRERHLRDKLHKVRLECQQAWEAAEKERKENAELRMEVKAYIANLNKTAEAASYFIDKYEAAKRQLDESNKQIETYAKKVRNLEAELEEGGFNDERNFI